MESASQSANSNIGTLVGHIQDGYGTITDEVLPSVKSIFSYTGNLTEASAASFATIFSLTSSLTERLNEWTHYITLVGNVIIAIFAVTVVLFIIGMVLGIVGAYYKASHGSSALTGAIVLGYIFSWIFLLISILIFAVGGHLERYICQGLNKDVNGSYPIVQVELSTT